MVLNSHDSKNLAVIVECMTVDECLHSEGFQILDCFPVVPNRPSAVALDVSNCIYKRSLLYYEVHCLRSFEHLNSLWGYGDRKYIYLTVIKFVETGESQFDIFAGNISFAKHCGEALEITVCIRKKFCSLIIPCLAVGIKKFRRFYDCYVNVIVERFCDCDGKSPCKSLYTLVCRNPDFRSVTVSIDEHFVIKTAILI